MAQMELVSLWWSLSGEEQTSPYQLLPVVVQIEEQELDVQEGALVVHWVGVVLLAVDLCTLPSSHCNNSS